MDDYTEQQFRRQLTRYHVRDFEVDTAYKTQSINSLQSVDIAYSVDVTMTLPKFGLEQLVHDLARYERFMQVLDSSPELDEAFTKQMVWLKLQNK